MATIRIAWVELKPRKFTPSPDLYELARREPRRLQATRNADLWHGARVILGPLAAPALLLGGLFLLERSLGESPATQRPTFGQRLLLWLLLAGFLWAAGTIGAAVLSYLRYLTATWEQYALVIKEAHQASDFAEFAARMEGSAKGGNAYEADATRCRICGCPIGIAERAVCRQRMLCEEHL